VRSLLDLLLPPHCPGCGREGVLLCAACEQPLLRRLDEPAGAPLGAPVAMPDHLVQLEWCGTYSGSVREALHALKYRGERKLADPLAAVLAERWARVGVGAEIVTWVPVHPSRRRDRGFDQAEELARRLAARLGLPTNACLERRERTQAQHTLGQTERAGNVAGAFQVRSDAQAVVEDRWLLLVDDILTTGVTLSACAAALLDAGALAVSAITVARDR